MISLEISLIPTIVGWLSSRSLILHYYISIQNPTVTSDGVWIYLVKLTKNQKDTFFFANVATSVG